MWGNNPASRVASQAYQRPAKSMIHHFIDEALSNCSVFAELSSYF
jgi:hypothetical protein